MGRAEMRNNANRFGDLAGLGPELLLQVWSCEVVTVRMDLFYSGFLEAGRRPRGKRLAGFVMLLVLLGFLLLQLGLKSYVDTTTNRRNIANGLVEEATRPPEEDQALSVLTSLNAELNHLLEEDIPSLEEFSQSFLEQWAKDEDSFCNDGK
ncbi:unnamed protein product [Protopolystoma xenopodis]|uniref:Uncharacterized protein n=1 Tax=Protopolystoma xenopodis TaxID=117903 RepID=A0A448XM97_9PLAT|nr:unnamed protein product [Protopolystoma xenopodis]